ncbi:dTDP-4-dehydrorhamnose 3,5-epimerase [Faecalicatena contorta]|nr:dTDP-4-dehydrorhamnose 3,5-epimerase [Faecalicatena contorta]
MDSGTRVIMAGFEFKELNLEGSYLINNFSVGDSRGGFTKCFEKDIYHDSGIDFCLSETFVSISAENIIRGLHFQIHKPQAKLVSVPHGRVYDVIVDLRPQSPTFKKWQGFELSAKNHLALYVPRGFAHGFASLESNSLMLYQCDGAYDKQTDTGIRFDDPEIGIQWPVNLNSALLSARDLQLMSFAEYMKNPMIISK